MNECSCQVGACDSHHTSAVAAHIENISRQIIDAFNNRHFDPATTPWNLASEAFHIVGAHIPRALNKVQTLEECKKFTIEYPAAAARFLSNSFSALVQRKAKWAQVFAATQASGGPSSPAGITRNLTCVLDFRCDDGQWLLVRMTAVHGAFEETAS